MNETRLKIRRRRLDWIASIVSSHDFSRQTNLSSEHKDGDATLAQSAARGSSDSTLAYSLGSLGKSKRMTCLTREASKPLDARSVHTRMCGVFEGDLMNSRRLACCCSRDNAAW